MTTRKLRISILAALFSCGTLLAPALANDTFNDNDSEAEADADNENTNVGVNENTNTSDSDSESVSEADSASEADSCALLCGVDVLSGL